MNHRRMGGLHDALLDRIAHHIRRGQLSYFFNTAGTWEAAQSGGAAGQSQYLESGFRLVLAANKADLLPHNIPRARLEVSIL